ncbi:MAG: hypothetical protein M1840_002136 [Geoglossum simile]|nr:MAG: hypothetical protein M1840_002136 [Geoglossum simile]
MGRKAPMAKELLEKAAAKGYQLGTHQEKNVIKEIPKYVQKTLKDQNWALNYYVKFIEVMEMKEKNEEDNKVERTNETIEMDSSMAVHCLQKGVLYSDLATTKDFLRFHIALSQERIKNKTTVDSVKTFAK